MKINMIGFWNFSKKFISLIKAKENRRFYPKEQFQKRSYENSKWIKLKIRKWWILIWTWVCCKNWEKSNSYLEHYIWSRLWESLWGSLKLDKFSFIHCPRGTKIDEQCVDYMWWDAWRDFSWKEAIQWNVRSFEYEVSWRKISIWKILHIEVWRHFYAKIWRQLAVNCLTWENDLTRIKSSWRIW